MKIKSSVIFPALLILMITGFNPPVANGQTVLVDSIAVSGVVEDNYATLSYSFSVHNSNPYDTEFAIDIPVSDGIYLSNVSIELTNATLWGHVYPIEEAQDIYNQTVSQNMTGALVTDYSWFGFYRILFNLKEGEDATLTVYVEGVINRKLGRYVLDIIPSNFMFGKQVSVDISVVSNLSPIVGIKFTELAGGVLSTITNGYSISYTGTVPASGISLEYGITKYAGDASIIGYSNGTDNFFGYYLAPEINTSSTDPGQYVFVLDRSGSMSGQPLSLVQTAFTEIVSSLSPSDLFSIIAFSTTYTSLWTQTRPATTENKNEAIQWVNSLTAGGSTNIYDSVIAGLDTFQTGQYKDVLFLLSDGKPNTGTYVNHQDIIDGIRANNVNEIPISTIAFGDSADVDLMSDIANTNNGVFVKVSNDESAVADILNFYQETASLPITDWSMSIVGAHLVNNDLTIAGSLSNGSEVVITGMFTSTVEITTDLSYPDKNVSITRVLPASLVKDTYSHLERLWAIQRIQYLLRFEAEMNTTQEIIDLALYYGLVVADHTGMVLTEMKETDPTDDRADFSETTTEVMSTTQAASTTYAPGAAPPEDTRGKAEVLSATTAAASFITSAILVLFPFAVIVRSVKKRS